MNKRLINTLIFSLTIMYGFTQNDSPVEIPKGDIEIDSYYLKDCTSGEFDDSFSEISMSWIWDATENNHIILQYSVDGVNKLIQMNPAFRINEDDETGETWVTFEGITGVQIVKSKDEDCLFCDESKITHEIDKVVLLYRRYSSTDVEFITLYEGECNKERFYTPED